MSTRTRMWAAGVATTVWAFGGALAAAAADMDSTTADSEAAGPMVPAGVPPAQLARMRAADVQRGLDETAARLEIRASQAPVWNDFSKALKALTAQAAPPVTPNPPADAATLLHRAADEAATRAQALVRLADAAGKLQAALDPNQRQVFDEIVRMRLREYAMRGMREGPVVLMHTRSGMRMPEMRMPDGMRMPADAEGTPQP